jgi:hypothetical protein
MAKSKTSTFPPFDYSNPENTPLIKNLFVKAKPDITLEEAIEAHKTLFSDPSKPVIEEDIKKYFNI